MQKSIGNNIYWTKEIKEFPTRSEITIWWPVDMFGMAHAMLTKIGISCQHEKNLVISPTFTGVLKHLRPPVLHAPNRSWITVASLRRYELSSLLWPPLLMSHSQLASLNFTISWLLSAYEFPDFVLNKPNPKHLVWSTLNGMISSVFVTGIPLSVLNKVKA